MKSPVNKGRIGDEDVKHGGIWIKLKKLDRLVKEPKLFFETIIIMLRPYMKLLIMMQ